MEHVHGIFAMTLPGMWLVYLNFVIMLLVMLFTSSSYHIDNHKINFLVLGEGPNYGINGSFASPEETFSINFTKPKTNFCLSLHYNGDNSYLFVNGKEIFKFKTDYKNVNFLIQFCLGSIYNGFGVIESRKVFLKGNMYDFSVHYNAIDKSGILSIHKYLMAKNKIKCLKLLKKCLLNY